MIIVLVMPCRQARVVLVMPCLLYIQSQSITSFHNENTIYKLIKIGMYDNTLMHPKKDTMISILEMWQPPKIKPLLGIAVMCRIGCTRRFLHLIPCIHQLQSPKFLARHVEGRLLVSLPPGQKDMATLPWTWPSTKNVGGLRGLCMDFLVGRLSSLLAAFPHNHPKLLDAVVGVIPGGRQWVSEVWYGLGSEIKTTQSIAPLKSKLHLLRNQNNHTHHHGW